MRQIYLWILGGMWLVFYVFWFASALRAKRNVRANRAGLGIRLIIVIALVALFNARGFRRFASFGALDPPLSVIGLVICAFGIGLAIWARVYIGRNWGMPMSVKEDPELVTTGPYRFIRHPIYSGILLGLLGSALVSGMVWLALFVVFSVYLSYAARAEERLMTQQFAAQYPPYQRRTKAFVPFIW